MRVKNNVSKISELPLYFVFGMTFLQAKPNRICCRNAVVQYNLYFIIYKMNFQTIFISGLCHNLLSEICLTGLGCFDLKEA